MAYIHIKDNLPGIVGLLFSKRSTGKACSQLAQAVLRGPSSLSVMERELIASYVSSLNECTFCFNSHSAIVNELAQDNGRLMSETITDIDTANISDKMKALLYIAGKVQQSGKAVSAKYILEARKLGATDADIHDTVIVAAAFCFFNRYVDGLDTKPMKNKQDYVEPARSTIKFGYSYPSLIARYFMKKMFRSLPV